MLLQTLGELTLFCTAALPSCLPETGKEYRGHRDSGKEHGTYHNRVYIYIYIWVSQVSGGSQEKNQARIEADRMDREAKRKTMQQRCGELFDELDANLGLQAFHPQHYYLPS